MLLWCELAEICGVAPDALREDLELSSLLSNPRSRLAFEGPLDDISYLILTESGDSPPPHLKLTTIGSVLDYLLTAEPATKP